MAETGGLGPCSMDKKPGTNWVERRGGLPTYICNIAQDLSEERGMSDEHAIRTAISRCKAWAAGGSHVKPATQAKAAKAIAEWEALKGKSKIGKKLTSSCHNDEEAAILEGMRDPSFELNLSTFSLDIPITKVDTDRHLAFGWASVAKRADGTVVSDLQGDEIHDLEAMEDVAYKFVTESRDGGEMHMRKGIGHLVESFVVTPDKLEKMGLPPGSLPTGWWCGFRVNDEEVWKRVKDGTYSQFSVHGKGRRTLMED